MHSGEWRRLLAVVLPASLAVALVAVLVAAVLSPGRADERGPAGGAPRIGRDHWHATFRVFVCGELQPPLAVFEAGVHTHSDGVIHIHPFIPSEEGAGARLVKFFEYGGGKLTQSEMRLPGGGQTFRNGDGCPDGSTAALQVYVDAEELTDWSDYIPQDGQHIDIVFGPPDNPLVAAVCQRAGAA